MSILILLAAALAGAIAGALVGRRNAGHLRGWKATLALALAALAAIVGTNSSESLIALGLGFTAVDVIEAASYFVFAFAATTGWAVATPPVWRWLFVLLVPLAMYEPLRMGWRLLKVLLR